MIFIVPGAHVLQFSYFSKFSWLSWCHVRKCWISMYRCTCTGVYMYSCTWRWAPACAGAVFTCKLKYKKCCAWDLVSKFSLQLFRCSNFRIFYDFHRPMCTGAPIRAFRMIVMVLGHTCCNSRIFRNFHDFHDVMCTGAEFTRSKFKY